LTDWKEEDEHEEEENYKTGSSETHLMKKGNLPY
jgi:hypothetical protein